MVSDLSQPCHSFVTTFVIPGGYSENRKSADRRQRRPRLCVDSRGYRSHLSGHWCETEPRSLRKAVKADLKMLEWLTVIVGVVGFAIILAMLARLWYMVIYGLVQIAREKRGEGGRGQSEWNHMEDSSLPRAEPKGT